MRQQKQQHRNTNTSEKIADLGQVAADVSDVCIRIQTSTYRIAHAGGALFSHTGRRRHEKRYCV